MADISIEIAAEFKKAAADIEKFAKQAEGSFKAFEESVKKSNRATDTFKGSLGAGLVIKGIEAVISSFGSLNQFIGDSIKASAEQEEAINSLNNALAANGNFTEEASNSFIRFSESISKNSKFSDDAIIKNAALLESLSGLSEKGLEQATQAAVDFAATGLVSLEDAFLKIGKAAEGEVGSFKKLGIEIKKGNTDAETFANTIEVLNSKFGGRAQLDAKTFSGTVAQMKNQFNELQEAIGFAIINNETFNGIVQFLAKSVKSLNESLGGNVSENERLRIKLRELISQQNNVRDEFDIYKKTMGESADRTRFAREEIANLQLKIDETAKTLRTLNDQQRAATASTKTLSEEQLKLQESAKKVIEETGKQDIGAQLKKQISTLKDASAQGLVDAKESNQAIALLSEDRDAAEVERLIKRNENLSSINAEANSLEIDENQKKIDALLNQEITHSDKLLTLRANADKKKKENDEKKRQEELKQQQTFFSTATSLASSQNKTLAAIGKAAALTELAIKTPQAVGDSFAFGARFGGPPLGFILAGIAATAMAVQASRVAGVPLQSGIDSVPGTGTRDNFPAVLAPGERVVPRRTNQDLTEFLQGGSQTNELLAGILSRLDRLENNVIVNIGAKEIIDVVNTGIKEGRVLAA